MVEMDKMDRGWNMSCQGLSRTAGMNRRGMRIICTELKN